MEQAIAKTGRRTGWSESENKLLWETADEAQQQGLPLKAVFEQIARQTGRKPNSRNYYYAQVRSREDGQAPAARFVPFTQPEVDWLMEQVLIARAEGQSVRACLQKLSGGDHSLMLRYQNKYRAVIKSRPDYVRAIVDRLNSEGVACDTPQVNHRVRSDLNASGERMLTEAQRAGNAELARAFDTITKYLCARREEDTEASLRSSVSGLAPLIKDFLALPMDVRIQELEPFCTALSEKLGMLEAAVENQVRALP